MNARVNLSNGFTGIMTWKGFDAFYYHHNAYSTWGQVGCTQAGARDGISPLSDLVVLVAVVFGGGR